MAKLAPKYHSGTAELDVFKFNCGIFKRKGGFPEIPSDSG